MQIIRASLCTLFVLTALAIISAPVSVRPDSVRPRAAKSLRDYPHLSVWYDQGRSLFASGEYRQAEAAFRKGREEARALLRSELDVWFLQGLGACEFAEGRYSKAIQTYTQGLAAAERTGNSAMVSYFWSNLASVHSQAGDADAALTAARRGLAASGPDDRDRPKLLVQVGTLLLTRGISAEAVQLTTAGIDGARRRRDFLTEAQAWNHLAYAYAVAGQVANGDRAAGEDLRLRRENRLPGIHLSYRNLGMLAQAKRHYASASRYFDRAIESAKQGAGMVPIWNLYYRRAQARLAEGHVPQAAADFRTALDLAGRWRADTLPSDHSRISVEAGLNELYSGFIEASERLYFHAGNNRAALEAFQACEESRASSLRALLTPADRERRLPAAYFDALRGLQRAETALLKTFNADTAAEAERLRLRIHEIELQSGVETMPARNPDPEVEAAGIVQRIQSLLGTGDALLTFHLGDHRSYVWMVTRAGFETHTLPAREHLALDIRAFSDAVKTGTPQANTLGRSLYADLFGPVDHIVSGKRRLLLSLDKELFGLPFAALVVNARDASLVYLIERSSLEIIPSAYMLSRSSDSRAGKFVGVGDPVYNAADARWPGSGQPNADALELSRLPGSGREIENCAEAWGAPSPHLLSGLDATKARVRESLRGHVSICHFATHVLPVPGSRKDGRIALSLLPSGDSDLLSPVEVAFWRPLSVRLVVLSGCSSGSGAVLPGTGLIGLTRSWLAAGADSVLASLWPTPDDSGQLFLSFYRQLRKHSELSKRERPALALQAAQLEMLRSRTWRASPGYWAAYFIVGKEQI